MAVVELLGMLGASLVGVIGLRELRGTASPYNLPVALVILKVPTGAITAVLGFLLIRGGFVPGFIFLPSSPQVLLGWAAVFGSSQQIFTRLIDRQALAILDNDGLGRSDGSAASADALEGAVLAVMQTSSTPPRLVNYQGVLSIQLMGPGDRALLPDRSGRFPLALGEELIARVTIGPQGIPHAQHVPLEVRDGDPAERVSFTVELIAETGPGTGERQVAVDMAAFGTADLPVPARSEADTVFWLRLSQRGALIQLVEVEFIDRQSVR